MTLYMLEMRNTQNWEDVRFRAYTTSERKSKQFKEDVPKVQFTDSGHGLVSVVTEVRSRKLPPLRMEHVNQHWKK